MSRLASDCQGIAISMILIARRKQTLRMLKLLGEHVIPKFDKHPVHRTTRLRAAAAGTPIAH